MDKIFITRNKKNFINTTDLNIFTPTEFLEN